METESPTRWTRDEMERRRLEAVELLKAGKSQAEVARRAGVSRTSVSRWTRRLRAGDSMTKRRGSGRPARLRPGQLYGLYRKQPDRTWSGKAFAAAIRDTFHVPMSRDHAGRLLRGLRGR